MLIIIPPSEGKQPPPDDGPVVDLASLSFPALTPTRTRLLDATIETSARPDAMRRLHVGPTLAEEVARNTALRELPTQPAVEVYAGPLYETLDAGAWSVAARARAAQRLVLVSGLWGALRPDDRIPPYRLHICSRLVDLEPLEPIWRGVLPDVLADAAGPRGVVVDLRSPTHQAMGRPTGLLDRTVTVRVADASGDGSRIGDVVSKRVRGEVARWLLETGLEPDDPAELATALGERWAVDLAGPARPTQPWTLSVMPRT